MGIRSGDVGHLTMMWSVGALILLAGCGGDVARELSVRHDTLPGGTVRVVSSRPAGWDDSASAWQLVPLRTIQPEEDNLTSIEQVVGMALAPDGSIVVGDGSVVARRLLYFPAGDTASRGILLAAVGDGPGEVRQPSVRWFGDSIVVLDRANLILFDRNGSLLESRLLSAPGAATVTRDGRIWYRRVDASRPRAGADAPMLWVRHGGDGTVLDSLPIPLLLKPAVWVDDANAAVYYVPFSATTVSLVLDDGMVVYGRTDQDQFILMGDRGDTGMIFGRTGAEPHPIPDESRRLEFQSRASKIPGFARIADLGDIPDHYQLWTRIIRDGLGYYWVGRFKPADYGEEGNRFDIYSPEGTYLGELAAPSGGIAVGQNHLAVSSTDGNGLPLVRIYRIVRN